MSCFYTGWGFLRRIDNWSLKNSENISTQKYDFERRLCAQTQDLQIFNKFNMSQMNPKELKPVYGLYSNTVVVVYINTI